MINGQDKSNNIKEKPKVGLVDVKCFDGINFLKCYEFKMGDILIWRRYDNMEPYNGTKKYVF